MALTVDSRGVPITASKPELLTLYENSVKRCLGWSNQPVDSAHESIRIDPDFTMGQVLSGLDNNKKPFLEDYDRILGNAKTERERKHVTAAKSLLTGHWRRAAVLWEDILVDHPADILALKLSSDCYIALGDTKQLRECPARLYTTWTRNYSHLSEYYGTFLGMYAFGLEENFMFEKAEDIGKKAVTLSPKDAWSVHSLAHVYDETGRYSQGIELIEQTNKDWRESSLYHVHNYWHKTLYHIELEQYKEALHIFDTQFTFYSKGSKTLLDLIDGASFLLRCEMSDVDIGDERWHAVLDNFSPLLHSRVSVFTDIHLAMVLLGNKKPNLYEELMESISNYCKEHFNDKDMTQVVAYNDIGIPILKSLKHYFDADYASCCNILWENRHVIYNIGGSRAQQDIVDILALRSAKKSNNYSVMERLVSERIERKPTSPQNHKWLGEILSNTNKREEASEEFNNYKLLIKGTIS